MKSLLCWRRGSHRKGLRAPAGNRPGGRGRFGCLQKRRRGGTGSNCFLLFQPRLRDLLPPAGLERGGRIRRAPRPPGGCGETPGAARGCRERRRGCQAQQPGAAHRQPRRGAGLLPQPPRGRSRDPAAQPGSGRGEQEPPPPPQPRTGPSTSAFSGWPGPTGPPPVAAGRAGPGGRRGLGRAVPSPPRDSPALPPRSPLLAAAGVSRCRG